ncbi:bifunctional glutamine synthetase adenylyltransferase/deadenyltransferase [Mergibacter septicus]|uniref:bifunctional [glutamate--ammonia ligase]-adenylyl-L-tyrosine phosphorylase/[glutamate--ammonia-ligase] adenylyltransferase n=1 Tax=Mergibacter septicus TaxID=221402 RepID=UPI0011798332|nr:bifunctional [glutamate--ammonia ligase]-adenylyl-L-tyrosine phosphorylase/[glutamate--ammonia-ligase] adenylyltransferase [Mergibacter septicus]AWX14393.1 bifunctional glutamine synthetase adenylyltransferase/deadenyltransferase [Mergibacter septicus]
MTNIADISLKNLYLSSRQIEILTELIHSLSIPEKATYQQLLKQSLAQHPEPLKSITISSYLSDFVLNFWQKSPAFFAECWLACNDKTSANSIPLSTPYRQPLHSHLKGIEQEQTFYAILRHFRHQEMAKLSLCQSLNLMTVEQVFRHLSELAEALVIEARDWLYPRLCSELGTPVNTKGEKQTLLILGMGKLGGFELNFSSDIDLIFTYPEHGQTQGARRSIDNAQFFTRLAQQLIKALTQSTIDGFVYRVDMRLRPFGEAGALVLSFSAMEDYYQEQGRDWERYAMIKARILGQDDNDPHQAYLRQLLHPFIYRRYLDFSSIQALREMKQKITIEVRRRGIVDNIKLGTGGIREIEFIVQIFQLIRGGREKNLQQQSLLNILPQLSSLNLLTEAECQQLHFAYLFLRRIENILQAIDDKQTQLLPSNPLDQTRLVIASQTFKILNKNNQEQLIKLPIKNWQDFYQYLHQLQQQVHHIFHHLIGEKEEQTKPSLSEWQDFFGVDFNLDDMQKLLQAIPHLNDPEQQKTLLTELVQFRQVMLKKSIGVRGKDVLERLIPTTIDQLLIQPSASILLPRIFNILEKIATRTAYLELLYENPNSLVLLFKLCSASPFIAEQIARYPLLLDELLNPYTLLNPPPFTEYKAELQRYLMRIPQDDEEHHIDTLRQFKLATQLRIASADILGALPVMKVSDHLTYLAEAIIEVVVTLAWQQLTQRYGTPDHLESNLYPQGFLVIGYGKLGGIELGYHSDLDLVFLHNAPPQGQTVGGKRSIDSSQFYLRLAQKIISIFNIKTSSGILYEIDMRLRPSGSAGLLVSTVKAFNDYQHNEAWTWERQALVRARAIFGDPSMQQQFNHIRQHVLSSPQAQTQLKDDVRQMREKMYQHLPHTQSGYFNLKTDRGGITDIEFIAQYLVLAYAPQQPALTQWSDNVRIFDNMVKYQILPQDIGERLKTSYIALRNQIHHLNLDGKKAIIPDQQFVAERQFIQQIWQRYLS